MPPGFAAVQNQSSLLITLEPDRAASTASARTSERVRPPPALNSGAGAFDQLPLRGKVPAWRAAFKSASTSARVSVLVLVLVLVPQRTRNNRNRYKDLHTTYCYV